jgi:DNA repair protein RadC
MQAVNNSIKDWARDDRPREKLMLKGSASLSDSELLAILIREGNRETNAIQLAREILKLGKNDLNELGRLAVKDLMKIRGIGAAKAITILAALELGRRRQACAALGKPVVTGSKSIANYLQALFRDLTYEVFAVVFLNRANRINHFEVVSEGGITGTIADPRVILKKALQEDAVSLILCHNHPSGSMQPSRADLDITQKIKMAAGYFDITILDHIIVSEAGYYSFADEGVL